MKTKNTWGAIRLCILGFVSSLAGLFNVGPSLGAKTGIITAPTGADANLVTLGASQPVRDTLMGVIRTALQLASALKAVIINFGVRKAILVPTATVITSVTGATDVTLQSTITREADGTWTTANEGGADADIGDGLDDIVSEVKPKLSVESLVNKIEDLHDELLPTDLTRSLMVVFDQAASAIKVYRIGNTAAATVHTAAVALAEDVQFVQTLDGGGTQFGE